MLSEAEFALLNLAGFAGSWLVESCCQIYSGGGGIISAFGFGGRDIADGFVCTPQPIFSAIDTTAAQHEA
jgi:hypothetical protein